jgi:hypothetical protein
MIRDDEKLHKRYLALHSRVVTLNFELRAIEVEVASVFKKMRLVGQIDSLSINADLSEIAYVAGRTKELAWDETLKACGIKKKQAKVARK